MVGPKGIDRERELGRIAEPASGEGFRLGFGDLRPSRYGSTPADHARPGPWPAAAEGHAQLGQ